MAHRHDKTRALEDQFEILIGKKLKTPWSIIEQTVDPDLREKTMEFMQAGWMSCLQMLKEIDSEKNSAIT